MIIVSYSYPEENKSIEYLLTQPQKSEGFFWGMGYGYPLLIYSELGFRKLFIDCRFNAGYYGSPDYDKGFLDSRVELGFLISPNFKPYIN